MSFRGAKDDDPVKELEEEVLQEVELVGRPAPHWKRLLPWQLLMGVVNLVKVRAGIWVSCLGLGLGFKSRRRSSLVSREGRKFARSTGLTLWGWLARSSEEQERIEDKFGF